MLKDQLIEKLNAATKAERLAAAKETGNLGCAILGAVATGAYPDITEAAAAMCSIAPAVLPNPEKKAVYERKYRMFLRVIEALDGVWDEMQSLIERREED